MTVIASALWVEVLRKAASQFAPKPPGHWPTPIASACSAIKPEASFAEVRTLELESRAAIFELVKSRYIGLIFDINAAFARRRFAPPSDMDNTCSPPKICSSLAKREADGAGRNWRGRCGSRRDGCPSHPQNMAQASVDASGAPGLNRGKSVLGTDHNPR